MNNTHYKLNHEFVPLYVTIVRKVFGKEVSATEIYTLFGLMVLLPWLLINLMMESLFTKNVEIAILDVTAVIFAGLILLSRAYEIMVANIDYISSMLIKEEQKVELNGHLERMFSDSANQRYFVIIFASLVELVLITIDINAIGLIKTVFNVLGFIAYIILGYGLWLAMTTMLLILRVSNYELKLPVFSNESEGLKALSVIGTSFALFFSIEVTLCIITLITVDWNYEHALELVFALLGFPVGIFVSVTFFLVTFFSIRKIIHSEKIKRSQKVERMLSNLEIESLNSVEKVEYYLRLNELHKQLLIYSTSTRSVFGFSSFFKTFTSILIPIIGLFVKTINIEGMNEDILNWLVLAVIPFIFL
jgi:hypothetical protein